MTLKFRVLLLSLMLVPVLGSAQDTPVAAPADLAFEQGRWEDAIREYRSMLDENPGDRLSWLRIAQAQYELGRYGDALATLDRAEANTAPEAMIHFERARNLLGLGKRNEALDELEQSDHLELRARLPLEEGHEFDPLRDKRRFERVLRNVRERVLPCEDIPEAAQFDFWVGHWEVRRPDGTLLGHSTVTREQGGCAVREQWDGISGSTGTSLSFYLPSRKEWRQVWIGASGTHIDMTGGLEKGEMHFEGTIEYFDPEDVVAFRSTWSVGGEGRVRQRMEQLDFVSDSWKVWFDGIYRRID